MMKRFLLFIFACCFVSAIHAQDSASFTWSKTDSKYKEGLQNPHLVLAKATGFVAYSIEKSNSQLWTEDRVYIHQFDTSGNSELIVKFDLPMRLNRESTLIKVIEGTNKLYFFSYLAIKKDQKNIVYVQVYDHTTRKVSEATEIFTLPIKRVNNQGFVQITASPNKKVMAVLVNSPFEKKTKEKIEVITLDENLNVLRQGSHELSFDSKRVYHETLFVDNAGDVSIVKKTDINKRRPITTYISIDGNGSKEQQVSADKFYISDHKVVTIKDKKYLFGFATNIAKPAATVGGAKDDSFFMYDLSAGSLITRKEWTKETIKWVLGKGFNDIQVKDVLIDGETLYLMGDCYTKKTKEVEGQNFVYNYIHLFGPGVAIKMNLSGEVFYDVPIKYQDEYKNDLEVLSSYYPFLKDGELFVLMNEKESKLKDKVPIIMNMSQSRARTIVLRSFDASGNVKTVPFWNSTVGRPKDPTKFSPSRIVQLSPNEFYVYATGGSRHHFGKMIIQQ